MSLPRHLALRTVERTPRVIQEPPACLLEQLTRAAPATVSVVGRPVELSLSGHSVLTLTWDPAAVGSVSLRLRGGADAWVELEHSAGTLRVTRGGPAAETVHPDFPATTITNLGAGRQIQLLISLDGPLLEVFANNGEATISNLVTLGPGPITATVDTETGGPIAYTAVDISDEESRSNLAAPPIHALPDNHATAL